MSRTHFKSTDNSILSCPFGECILDNLLYHPSTDRPKLSRNKKIEYYRSEEANINKDLIALTFNDNDRVHYMYVNLLNYVENDQQEDNSSKPIQFKSFTFEKCTTSTNNSNKIAFSHASMCPVLLQNRLGLKFKLAKKETSLAVCVVVELDNEEEGKKVLITRRTSHMRTFPSAWVLPGGHVDANESLQTAACRELLEETGIQLTEEEKEQMKVRAAWESIFPPFAYSTPATTATSTTTSTTTATTAATTTAATATTTQKTTSTSAVTNLFPPPKAHCIVFYVSVSISSLPKIALQAFETDSAAWIPVASVEQLITNDNYEWSCNALSIPTELISTDYYSQHQIEQERLQSATVTQHNLGGIYPNKQHEGIARGHAFALTYLYGTTNNNS